MPRYVVTALIVACALFMENLDGTVLSTALPAIARDLHEDPIALKLALTSYLLALAVFIPASGWMADRFGTRTVFRAAIAVFMTGSILCGLSSSLGGFVVARVIQGMGGAMMVPVGRLLMLRSVERSDLVRAMAFLTVPALLGPMMGPPVGGFITTYFDWRYIFWINIPIGVLGIILVTLRIENIREAHMRRLDFSGLVLSGMGLASLVFGFTILGRGFVPSWAVALLIAFGAVVMGFYVRHARRTEAPILDLALLEVETFRVSITGGSLFRVGVGAMAMKTTASPILNTFGFRRVLVVNAIIGAGFIAMNGLFSPATPLWLILALLLVGGFFRSLQFTSVNTIAYADIDADRMSRAVGFASVAQQLALSVGVAVGAGVLQIMRDRHGGALSLSDFHWAFAAVGLLSATSVIIFARLPADAGAALASRPGKAATARAIADARPHSAAG